MLSFGMFAQKIQIQNASNYSRNNDLVRAMESIEAATTNAETSEDCKAWYLKGTILLKLDDMYSMVEMAKPGMTENELNKAYAPFNSLAPNSALKPNSKKSITMEDGSKGKRAAYLYDVIVLFGPDGKLIEASEPTNGKYKDINILNEAKLAFDKSIKIGTEEEFVTNSKINLNVVSQRYYNVGVNKYQNKKYLEAADKFESCYDMSKDYFGIIDSTSLELVNNSIRMYMQECLNASDTAAFLNACELGRSKFPQDVYFILSEANIYLAKNEPAKVVQYLEEAMKMVSDNPDIYYAVGVNYAALGSTDKAIAAYQKALELNPNYFDACYNLAAIYVNTGNDMYTEANNLPLDAQEKYNELKKQADNMYNLATPYLEKAYSLNNTEINVLRTLKDIYVRMQKFDDLKRINEILNNIESE